MAIQAVYDYATLVASGLDYWPEIDRIERRWNIQGSALAYMDGWKAADKAFRLEQKRIHDRMFPDRLTYLHR